MLRDYELGASLVDNAPCDIQGIADGYTSEERRDAVESLESLAFAAIWRAAYMEMRYGSGCGDQGHEDAVKHANRVLKSTRKAMGYSVTRPIVV